MSGYQTISAFHKFRFKNQIVNQPKDSQTRSIPQWQSNKMKQIIIERWQEIWVVVEARNKTKKLDRVVKSDRAYQ